MEMIVQSRPKRIAVVNLRPIAQEMARGVIRSSNWPSAEFRCIDDLMSALSLGAQVDILLVAPEKIGGGSFDAVRVAWRAVGLKTPLLLMVQKEQLEKAAAFVCEGHSDFILESCDEQELAFRLLVLGRKSARAASPLAFLGGRYRFRKSSNTVEVDGTPIQLTPREFDLTLHLFRSAGEVQSRKVLYLTFWSPIIWGKIERIPGLRTLDAHIAKIRRKLRLHLPERGCELRGIYGQGYLLSFLPSQR